MNILDIIFRRNQKTSAQVAKERLQIIVSHERAPNQGAGSDFLPLLQKEIIDVIKKYFVGVDSSNVKVELQRTGSTSVLELNVALPEQEKV